MAFDPVCNMEVDPTSAQWTSEYKGTTYYFCEEGCKRAFEKAPMPDGTRDGIQAVHADSPVGIR